MRRCYRGIRKTIALLVGLVLMLSALTTALAESFSAVVTSDSMAVYQDASLTKQIGTLAKYSVVTVEQYSGGVARISSFGNQGYAKVSRMTAVSEIAMEGVLNQKAKIYLEPDTDSASITLKKGELVNVIEIKGKWALIELNGVGAYIYAKYVDPVESAPVATATPSPTATPGNVTYEEVPAKVTASSLKVYSAASTGADHIGTLYSGEYVMVHAFTSDWAYIELDGNYGYVSLSGLKAVSAIPTATPKPTATPSTENAVPATVTASSVRVYENASTRSTCYGKLMKGTEVNVIDYNSTWAFIEMDGNYGYCSVDALTPNDRLSTPTPAATATPSPSPTVAPTSTPEEVTYDDVPAKVTASSLKVYNWADESATHIGTVYEGEYVMVHAYTPTWAYIEVDGNYGFCKLSGLKAVASMPTATPTPSPAPTAEPTEAPIDEEDVVFEEFVAKVTGGEMPVFGLEGETIVYLTDLPEGTLVTVYAYTSDVAVISYNDEYGFCMLTSLKRVSEDELATPTPSPTATPSTDGAIPATVTASSVRVYEKANTSSTCYGKLKRGTVVNVLDYNKTWAHIEMDGNYGYCKVSALTPNDQLPTATPTVTPTPTPSTENAVPATVTASSVKVYAMANTKSTCYGALKQGTVVNVLDYNKTWAHIEMDGNYGYCSIDALTPNDRLSTPTPSPLEGFHTESFTATVVEKNAPLYSQPSKNSDSKAISLGTNVQVHAYNATYAYVTADGTQGFMLIDDLDRTTYETLSTGSTGSAVSTLEKALLALGYFDGNTGNTYNAYTVDAVKRFQSACGLSETGTADERVQRILYSGSAPASSLLSSSYERGDSGSDVKRIQLRLFALGYLSKSSSVDGSFGYTTLSAVKLFQNSNGITPSGEADSATLKKLYSTAATALPSGKSAADAVTTPTVTAGNQANNSTQISQSLASTTSEYDSSMSAAEKLEYVIYVGQNQLGKPYIYGMEGPSSYDCTGFTWYCFKKIGISLPRTAYNQGYNNKYDRITSISELRRGDLVYFNTVSDSDLSDHAGIYLGAGYFIHSSSGQGKVVVSSLSSGYYNRVFSWAHRVIE